MKTPEQKIRKAKKTLKYALKVGKGWLHDTNPHGDIHFGESADYDAALTFCEVVQKTLNEISAE